MTSVKFRFQVDFSQRPECTWRLRVEAVFNEPIAAQQSAVFDPLVIGTSSDEGVGLTSKWARDYWTFARVDDCVGVCANVPRRYVPTGFQVDGKFTVFGDSLDVKLDYQKGQVLFTQAMRTCREQIKEVLGQAKFSKPLWLIVFHYLDVTIPSERTGDYGWGQEIEQITPSSSRLRADDAFDMASKAAVPVIVAVKLPPA